MTLKEKFEQWFINDEEDEHYEGMVNKVAIEHEKVADDFAIGFAEWLMKTRFKSIENIPVEKLLEIYKQQQL